MAATPKKGADKRKPKPPVRYSIEICDRILIRIAAGEALCQICKGPDMPDQWTFYSWLQKGLDDLPQRYARAREQQAETFADQLVPIADTAIDAGLGRLRVDARRWAASKLYPKKYGEKTTTEVTGADGGPLAVTMQAGPELAAVVTKLRAKLGV